MSGVLGLRECKEVGDLDMQVRSSTDLRHICWIRSALLYLHFLLMKKFVGHKFVYQCDSNCYLTLLNIFVRNIVLFIH